MKTYKSKIVILLIVSIIGLYLVSKEDTNKYLKSMGYVIVGISVIGVTILKRKQLKESI
jgi:hypothetical protein